MTKSLSDIQGIIQSELSAFIAANNKKSSIYQPISYLLQAGGKRIRPAMSLMAANLFLDDLSDAVHPAIGIEVFHNFTLMHDDIMDNAPLRRGLKTVHEKWNTNVAILSGDAMLIQSYQLLANTKPELVPRLLEVFNNIGLEVCEGQQMDMEFESRKDVSVDEYLTMIRLKTSVLLAGAMQMGAIIGGADEITQKLMYEFGENLGMAFQLRDDYLDAFGDPSKTGKQPGGDILADKKTLLLIRSLEKSTASTRLVLDEFIGNPNSDPTKKVSSILGVFEELGIRQELQDLIVGYDEKAIQSLKSIQVDNERKKPLLDLATTLLTRES